METEKTAAVGSFLRANAFPLSAPGPARKMTAPAMTLAEVTEYLTKWISQLHEHLSHYKKSRAEEIWDAFYNLTYHTLYPWDQEYLQRMPQRRRDGSIFLSLVTYRDENCLHTLQEAYNKAKDAHQLFVGLVQQNCHHDCVTGIMDDGKSHPADPDPNCYQLFCASDIGKPHCEANRVRILDVDEPESLGPYMARYFASKLWDGEEWYMQVQYNIIWKFIHPHLMACSTKVANQSIFSHSAFRATFSPFSESVNPFRSCDR